MPPFKSIAGQKFGRLTAIRVHQKSKRTANGYIPTTWLCLCECGVEKVIARGSLTQGLTTSCGCKHEERLKAVRLPGGLGSIRRQIWRYKIQAEQRGFTWNLVEEECVALFSNDCHYCGAPPTNYSVPTHGSKFGGALYNGIDRIDSTQGYHPGNVVTACFICNRAKSILGYNEFLDWIQRCAAHIRMRDRKLPVARKEAGKLFA